MMMTLHPVYNIPLSTPVYNLPLSNPVYNISFPTPVNNLAVLFSLHMVITYEFASRGGYIQLKGHHIGLQKCHGPWPRLPWFKSGQVGWVWLGGLDLVDWVGLGWVG